MSEWQDYSDDFQWKDSFSSLRGKLVQIGESIWYSAGGSCGGMVQYSIKTNKIVSKTKYSTNIKPPINHCCCKFNNTIIIVNGDQGEIISFNPSTKQFEKKINTPEIGWKACCINMNNDIHIFHGIHNCKHLIYSPKTNKLKILNDATTTQNIEEVCVLKYGNKLIRFGGYCMDEMKSLNSLFISSPVIQMNKTNKTIKWQLKCKLVKGLFGCGYILYDNTYIITFGGSHSWAEYIDTIFVLNIKQNGNWFELKQIKCPLPSAYLAILDSENNIHLFTQHNKHAVKKHFVCKISTILRHIYDAVEVFNKEIRVSWQIGSNCRIYSRSSDKWYAGKVDKICGSGEDEWLIVKYSVNNKNKKKEIQRNCKDIKPFIPVLKYKYVNSNNWKQFENFVNVNADINNDYNYSARILHPQLFDDEIKDEFEIFENNNNNYNNYANSHNRNSSQILDEVEKQNNIDNHFSYEILLMDKENNNSLLLVHSDTVRDTFNCNTNEELSRNMTCPSLYLSSNHVLSARKWIPDSDLYGTIMIKCHHTIMIMKNGCINGNGSGYTSHYGLGHGLYYKEPNKLNQGNKYYSGGGYGSSGIKAHNPLALGGKCYGDKYLANVSHFGSPSGGRERGGGIIQLIAKYIINYGKICCDGDSGKQFGGGSGGSIKLVCQKFINYGKITCCGGKGGTYERKFQNNTALRVGGDGGNGRIAIYCQQYINKGQIIPNPTVIQDKEKFIFSSDIQFTPLALGKDNQFYV
eukprot:222266_1